MQSPATVQTRKSPSSNAPVEYEDTTTVVRKTEARRVARIQGMAPLPCNRNYAFRRLMHLRRKCYLSVWEQPAR